MLGATSDEQLADEPAFGAGLFGDEHIAEHRLGHFENFVGGFAELHAAFETVLESPFAATAGMDLGFDHDQIGAFGEKFFRDALGGLRCVANVARGKGHSGLGEELTRLVLVYVHVRLRDEIDRRFSPNAISNAPQSSACRKRTVQCAVTSRAGSCLRKRGRSGACGNSSLPGGKPR